MVDVVGVVAGVDAVYGVDVDDVIDIVGVVGIVGVVDDVDVGGRSEEANQIWHCMPDHLVLEPCAPASSHTHVCRTPASVETR